MSYNSFNVIFVAILQGYLEEYLRKIDVGKTRLRERIRVNRQRSNIIYSCHHWYPFKSFVIF